MQLSSELRVSSVHIGVEDRAFSEFNCRFIAKPRCALNELRGVVFVPMNRSSCELPYHLGHGPEPLLLFGIDDLELSTAF
jgi:hypothetical protein